MNAVEMVDIVKQYPGVLASNHVNFSVRKGEIHGLVGENGAGKSTLMNILYGMQTPDSGEIRLHGEKIRLQSPKDAINAGIGMVHQHFMLAPSLSVLDNIIMGKFPTKGGFIDRNKARTEVEKILKKYNFSLELDAKVYQLSIGQMQRVEIVKALYRGADILILDEPTAVLTPQEADELIHTMRTIQKDDTSIIIITHKLKEVMRATDRVTVLRRGTVTGCLNTCDTNEHELAELMVGHELNMSIAHEKKTTGNRILQVEDLCMLDKRGRLAVDHISFDVHAGEIVGICGVEGNGQSELVSGLTGLTRPVSGQIWFEGEQVQHRSVRARRDLGMSHIPEDRIHVGAARDCSIKENLMLTAYYKKDYCKHNLLNNKALNDLAGKLIEKYAVKVPDADYAIGTLSGGNMQKVVIAREIDVMPRLLVASQPTRGVDIGAIMNIRGQLNALRESGVAILLVSAELEEIMSLSDRILVMYEGQIVGQFTPEETTEQELGLYMAGARRMNVGGPSDVAE
ncbi:MAG: ABC transporter ATP-binding protein [Clostridiales bacterium]|nr:ABC transporter ATP-binding protein [Clostridiales bacterium]